MQFIDKAMTDKSVNILLDANYLIFQIYYCVVFSSEDFCLQLTVLGISAKRYQARQ